ncbi:MAG: bifunctional diaminohydroxyphosphoribosylaminopyrimidine deaminase/5-amino-6-(5-phosphoribosylamino)uracil reductase RibD [Hyphomicrobiales bacterium]|nr:bifunctional diaminohydroxyphosphoribosylaminopyrimidine deaminase/5-amino-6-(5-phosphoribosylamino)uracil reductase RibD [Hyphomicrobiales bacterium]
MRQALSLGARHFGLTAPNPSVGTILVDESGTSPIILARAVTAPGGRPHAETLALEAAGARARGASLFVTLEPCAHHGRTPPCAEALIAAGVARVVCGIEDPDPRVGGKGLVKLRQAGVEVVSGVLEAQCRTLHGGHILRVTQGRPHVTLKLAMTADGFAACADKAPLRITGAIADAQTHLMRARSDAIMVGIGTVLADDPLLTCRLPGLESRSPVRVVFDSRLRIPQSAALGASAGVTPTWVITREDAPHDARARLEAAGVTVIRLGANEFGRVDVGHALRALGARGLTRVLCEGGPALAEELAKADLIDEFVAITGSRSLGRPGLVALGPTLSDAILRHFVPASETLDFGEDRFNRYVRARPCSPAS